MTRRKRNPPGGYVYHVLNRAQGRKRLFHRAADYRAFLEVVREARLWFPVRILEFSFMPNHWHFLLWPEHDEELAGFMHHLTGTHANRWNHWRGRTGTGHVYQGPYKYFPIETDDHLWTVARYIVRNPVRAGLVERARDWPWSSLAARYWQSEFRPLLSDGPLSYPAGWEQWVDEPQTEEELAALRRCVQRGRPFGSAAWQRATAEELGITGSLREAGRPRRRRQGA